MVIINDVTIYQCEHCKKKLFRKYAMEQHIRWCFRNPDNSKKCIDCRYIQNTTIEIFDQHESEYEPAISHNVNAFKCKKLDQMMYPLIVEKKNLPNRFPDTFEDQIPMPKECDLYAQDYSKTLLLAANQ